jgi:hypothetical protein
MAFATHGDPDMRLTVSAAVVAAACAWSMAIPLPAAAQGVPSTDQLKGAAEDKAKDMVKDKAKEVVKDQMPGTSSVPGAGSVPSVPGTPSVPSMPGK